MKATAIVFSMILPIAACGTNTQSTITNAQTNSASQAEADTPADETTALSAASISAFTAAYSSLDPSVIPTYTAELADDGAVFVDIDVSTQNRSASFGHTTTLHIPAGTANAPTNPNASSNFYVVYGPSTNAPGATYGPFVVTKNDLGMSATKVSALIAASNALDATAFTAANAIAAFPVCDQFADIDNTPTHESASFGHTITLRVPAGVTGSRTDPDLATTFYVELGASTNAPGGTYGPFNF